MFGLHKKITVLPYDWSAGIRAFPQNFKEERLFIDTGEHLREWTDKRPKYPRFHVGCTSCCVQRACHWNPRHAAVASIFRASDGYTYMACGAHMDMLYRRSQNVGQQPDDMALGPVTLRA